MDKDLLAIVTDQNMTYDEAAKFLESRLSLSPKEFYGLRQQYRAQAFTVSGYSSLKVIETFQSELARAVTDGISMGEFKSSMDDFLGRNGYTKLHPKQADNIFRTNVQSAYNAGAYAEMTTPGAVKARPYWQYDTVMDRNTRPSHRALSGKVFPADDPLWDTWYPPNGFRCRCAVNSLSQRQVDAMGLTVESKIPNRVDTAMGLVSIQPDKDFGHNPAKVRFTPDLDGVPNALKKAFERREKASPENGA